MDRRFRNVLESVLGVDASTLTDDDSPRTIPQWDSVNHLQLMLALEAEYGIQFSPDEIAKLSSIGLLRERLAAETTS
jgi:acyl carrier protein